MGLTIVGYWRDKTQQMKKLFIFAFLFQFSFSPSTAQINNLSVFLATSEMSIEDLIPELQYKWKFSNPTEKFYDDIVEGTYTFTLDYRGFRQVLERKVMVNREYDIKMNMTSLLFNDIELLNRIKENLPYQGFQLKSTDNNQSLYKNGYHTIVLMEGITKDEILAEGYYKLEIYSYREELLHLLLDKETPDAIPDNATNVALNKILNGNGKKSNTGEVIAQEESKNVSGNPSESSYYGSGLGDGMNRLGGRKVVGKQTPSYDCDETGIIVVQIQVDQTGKVVDAKAGIKGTTNSAPCLLESAKKAALLTVFNEDFNAPVKQVGSIIYSFRLLD